MRHSTFARTWLALVCLTIAAAGAQPTWDCTTPSSDDLNVDDDWTDMNIINWTAFDPACPPVTGNAVIDANISGGRFSINPQCTWFATDEAVSFARFSVPAGCNFRITARDFISTAADGMSPTPASNGVFRLCGLQVRDPLAPQPDNILNLMGVGNSGGVWQNVLEQKTTNNGSTSLSAIPQATLQGDLRVCRIGNEMRLYFQNPGGTWALLQTYIRPDLNMVPVNVGVAAYDSTFPLSASHMPDSLVSFDRFELDSISGFAECLMDPCPDADADGVCDADDICPGSDDSADADGDGVPDGCDICAGFDDGADADGDGVPDGCDNCLNTSNPGQEDQDGDHIGDACEGCSPGEDRDGDSIPDCADPDPQGYFYCEETGEIVTGGMVLPSGPGNVNLIEDGSMGRYMFLTDGTPGVYSLNVTPPPGLPLSTSCAVQGGTYDATGGPQPTALGAGENGNSGLLTSNLCADNTYYLFFDLAVGDPIVINNNIPVTCGIGPPPAPDIPALSPFGMFVLTLLFGALGFYVLRRREGRAG